MRATITIPGKPRGKPRARYDSVHRHTYRRADDVAYEARVISAWEQAGSPRFGDAALALTIIAYDAMPKGRPKRIVAEHYTTKPDVDNLTKAVTDPLNGLAWSDDAHIVSLVVVKHDRTRDEEPRVVVEIDEIGDDSNAH